MFLGVLIFSLCASTVKSQFTSSATTGFHQMTQTTAMMLDTLHLVATPDYPVAAGQEVRLDCRTMIPPDYILWSKFQPQNQSWETVTLGYVLLLTKPQESGMYSCKTHNVGIKERVSQNHTVFIISMPTTGEVLGKAAFALSILILIAIIAGVLWLVWQTFGNKLTALNAPKKTPPPPPPEVIPKVLPPAADADDVYMNYTPSTYTDLNPSNMTGDGCYSSLS